MSLRTFHRFARFPVEIQRMVFEKYEEGPRIITIKAVLVQILQKDVKINLDLEDRTLRETRLKAHDPLGDNASLTFR